MTVVCVQAIMCIPSLLRRRYGAGCGCMEQGQNPISAVPMDFRSVRLRDIQCTRIYQLVRKAVREATKADHAAVFVPILALNPKSSLGRRMLIRLSSALAASASELLPLTQRVASGRMPRRGLSPSLRYTRDVALVTASGLVPSLPSMRDHGILPRPIEEQKSANSPVGRICGAKKPRTLYNAQAHGAEIHRMRGNWILPPKAVPSTGAARASPRGSPGDG